MLDTHSLVPVVTIDGPSATGKGTVSRRLARELGWDFLESGTLYRAVVCAARKHHVDLTNEQALGVLAAHLDIQFKIIAISSHSKVILEGEDVTSLIWDEACGNDASRIAILPEVRKGLLTRQRAFCRKLGLVAEGRDMGTVVFPQAPLKIYLDASEALRAQRRYNQLKQKGISVNLSQVTQEMAQRDKRDRQRAVSPLKPAKNAIIVDTTSLDIEQVFAKLLKQVQDRFKGKSGGA